MTFKLSEIGLVPVDWEISELKTKATITMGQSPKSDSYNSECIGMPFMQGRKTFGDKYHSIDTWCTDPKKIAKKNDVLISVRAPVGDVNVATTDLCIGRGLASLRMHNGNNEFLYYLLKNYSKEITNRETGTVFASINKKGLETIKLPFPSDIEQKAIANILSTLDEKIETNNKINEKLEEMAQVLFKHWFVDFEFPNENGEPYKSSGGEMVESELGMIPIGWKIESVGDITSVNIGKTPPRKEKQWFSQDMRDIRWISIKDLGNSNVFINHSTEYLTTEAVEKFNIKKVPDNTVVLSFKLTVGRIAITIGEMATNEAIAHFNIVDKDVINPYYLYLYLKDFNFQSLGSTSSIATAINSKLVRTIPVLIPDRKQMEKFRNFIAPLFKEIRSNVLENEKLYEIRELLCPKLMSGEIRVPLDNEELVEQS